MNTELLNRTYKVLVRRGPLSCSEIGWALWGKTSTSIKGAGIHKNNKFCRPAGKILKVLKAQGRVSKFENGKKVIWKAIPSGGSYGRDFISDNFLHEDLAQGE